MTEALPKLLHGLATVEVPERVARVPLPHVERPQPLDRPISRFAGLLGQPIEGRPLLKTLAIELLPLGI